MAMSKGLKSTRPPTKATARRSQLITTYGVGAILPVESESFIVAGLDEWKPSQYDVVDEPRLCSLLGVSQLYAPPGGEGGRMVPIARFPEWVYCPKCFRLEKFWRIAEKIDGRYINKCKHCVTARLVPSRFVACCGRGHIQDFPYKFWVHQGSSADLKSSDHSLRITTDPSNSTLAGITVNCTCGRTRTLEGALGSGAFGMRCGGSSPWLDGDRENCGEQLVGLQRGASNVWFADVRSALTVDRTQSRIEEVLEKVLPELTGLEEADAVTILGIRAKQHGVDKDQLVAAYRAHSDEPTSYEEALKALRADEYEALGRSHPEIDGTETFVCLPTDVPAGHAGGGLVERVSRVTRLREVRALRGFARVSAVNETASTAPGVLSRKRVDWLPAVEVLGEGVFIRLAETALVGWETSDFARRRAETLLRAMRAAAPEGAVVEPVTPRSLVLHSLSHALLNELALDTGYPASSIRERVYSEAGQSGILLYTATADAAGSLGGLCSHGTIDEVSRLFETAAERAQWCSADPVCLESMSTGAGAANLAACHSCLLVPEVSCEHQNKMLDRACLVGLEGKPDKGFLLGLVRR